MTEDEILKIKEHIEIHARREPRAIKITEIMWKAVDELEKIKELEKENEVMPPYAWKEIVLPELKESE